jgi:hypothetical protein
MGKEKNTGGGRGWYKFYHPPYHPHPTPNNIIYTHLGIEYFVQRTFIISRKNQWNFRASNILHNVGSGHHGIGGCQGCTMHEDEGRKDVIDVL